MEETSKWNLAALGWAKRNVHATTCQTSCLCVSCRISIVMVLDAIAIEMGSTKVIKKSFSHRRIKKLLNNGQECNITHIYY